MKLRVGFSKTNSLISKVIRWVIGAPFSHTYIRFTDEFLGMNLIAHADWPGVLLLQAEKFDKENQKLEEFEFDLDILKVSLVRNLRFLGSRYDYLSILGWAWTIALRRAAKIIVQNPLDDPKSLICVDFCIRVLNDAGLTAIPVGSINPKGLVNYLRKHHKEMGGERFVFERTE